MQRDRQPGWSAATAWRDSVHNTKVVVLDRALVRRAATAATLVSISLIASALVGCGFADQLLEVESPSRVLAENLEGPGAAGLLVRSAIGDFECAFGGFIVAAGLHGDELMDSQQNQVIYKSVDRRTTTGEEGAGAAGGRLATATCNDNETLPGIYTTLQTARFQADDAARKLEGWTDAQVAGRQALLATVSAYAGYALLLLAESYCSLAIDVGPEITRPQAFAEAEGRFTEALTAAQASGDQSLRNLALVGRARARLDLAVVGGSVVSPSKLAEAGADAQQVAAGFVRHATFAATPDRRKNVVFNANNVAQTATIQAPFRNVTDQGEPDPRARVVDTGQPGSDNLTPLWTQTKYSSLDASIPIARWAEAQLIRAEAQGGSVAVGVINALHSAVGLRPFPGGTEAEIRQHVIDERGRELFLEGQHLGDKLRYGIPFRPPAGTPYPGGGTYGSTTCLPLPLQERQNNPNL